MKKNTSTKWIIFAFDRTTNAPKTGDAANITANVRIDGGGANAVDDTNPTELEAGYYVFDITAAECNGDLIVICPVSSTSDIQVIGVPGAVWTDTLDAALAVVDGIADDLVTAVAALPTDADVNAACDTAITDAALATATELAAAKTVVDVIAIDVAGLDGAAMRGTDAALLAVTYTAPANPDVSRLASLPILSEIEASTVLAKEATVGALSFASQASVDALPTAADVNAACDAAITDAALATAASIAALAFASQASVDAVQSAVDAIDVGALASQASVDLVAADVTNILTDTGATLDAKLDTIDAVVDAIKVVTDVIGASPSAADIADAVWDEVASGHAGAGTSGKALTDAASAGDPWSTPLPGAYTPGQAGKIISDMKIEVDAVLVDTGTTLDGKLNTIDGLVDAFSPAAVADAVWDETVSAHAIDGSTGKKLSDAAAAGTPATPEDIADAVWNEATIDHTVTGSAGEALLATISSLYPSAVSIAAALWSKIVTGTVSAETALASLYNGWTAGSGAGSGAGAIATEITVNAGGLPVDGVEVWVTTDEAGTNVVAGTLSTDAFGKVTFMLDAGTYFIWKQTAGLNFTNPETIIVTP